MEKHRCPAAVNTVTIATKQPFPTISVVAPAGLPVTFPLGRMAELQSTLVTSVKVPSVSTMPVLSDDQSRSIREALSKLRKDCPVFGILVIGRTGVGKSTLINNLLGKEVASVGHTLQSETPKVNPHEVTVEGVPIVVYDTPGLGDIKGEEEEKNHLDIMKALLARKKIHLVVYCFQMNEVTMRSSIVGALRKYHKIGVDWEQSVIALTFADALYVPKRDQEHPNFKMSEHFDETLAFWQDELEKKLIETVGVESNVIERLKIYPTTPLPKDQLPNGEPWYVPLWLHIVDILPLAATVQFLQVHRNNICDEHMPPLNKVAKLEVKLSGKWKNQLADKFDVVVQSTMQDTNELNHASSEPFSVQFIINLLPPVERHHGRWQLFCCYCCIRQQEHQSSETVLENEHFDT